MNIQAILKWFMENWSEAMSGVLTIIGGASVIVKLTPSTKDDEILGKINAILGFIALNPKQSPKA